MINQIDEKLDEARLILISKCLYTQKKYYHLYQYIKKSIHSNNCLLNTFFAYKWKKYLGK
jgi:hypothetical protein